MDKVDMKTYEVDGVVFQSGLPYDEELEGEDWTEEELRNQDPEGWREYADVMDAKQIAWLRLHPEHDRHNSVAHWDEYHRNLANEKESAQDGASDSEPEDE